MAHRPVETYSIRQSSYHNGYIRTLPESSWEVVAAHKVEEEDDTAVAATGSSNSSSCVGGDVLPCTYLDLATNVHLHGTEQRMRQGFPVHNSLRWKKDVHFHDSLRLPPGSANKGIVAVFEAMASEGVAVALSPQPAFQRGVTTEITFGTTGNTKTTILRKHSDPSEVSVPCRVCNEGTWNAFWIAAWKGKTYAGVGNLPGQKCLVFLDAAKSEASSKDVVASENPNDGMDATEEKLEADAAAGSTTTASSELLYVGLGNVAQQRRPVKVRNLRVTTVPNFLAELLENTTEASCMNVLMDHQEDIDDEALKEYQEQCKKAKARAEKFGIEYKEPSLATVIPWSQARKLRANPQKGFITGIDVTDAEEQAKQEARKERFGLDSKKRELDDGDVDGVKKDEVANEESAVAMTDTANDESIPISQAWDNEELVRFQRSDPPSSLWKTPEDGDAESISADEFSMETDKPTIVPEKIHIFSIDWSAFKQIRTGDLMAHFNIYGPSYVEWLGDLECNILFEDKFSAVRALQAMSEELPSPPPANLNPEVEDYVPPDFGAMGWRMGKKFVRKIKNDRFGRKGTIARILMRPATSLDILQERPSSWPDPPPGFSTRRILGPGDDFNTSAMDDDDEDHDRNDDGSHRKKRRRRNSNNDNERNDGNNNRGKRGNVTGKRRQRGSNPPSNERRSTDDLLSQGLSGGRAGFSVEEMEAMRAAKKNAISS